MSDDKSKLTLIEATVEINRLKKYVLELEACIKDMKKNSGESPTILEIQVFLKNMNYFLNLQI